jgi:hypothetical protein
MNKTLVARLITGATATGGMAAAHPNARCRA